MFILIDKVSCELLLFFKVERTIFYRSEEVSCYTKLLFYINQSIEIQNIVRFVYFYRLLACQLTLCTCGFFLHSFVCVCHIITRMLEMGHSISFMPFLHVFLIYFASKDVSRNLRYLRFKWNFSHAKFFTCEILLHIFFY